MGIQSARQYGVVASRCGDPNAHIVITTIRRRSKRPALRAQLRRPAFRSVANLNVRYLPYSELETHRESIARFGHGLKPIEAIARVV